MPSITIQGQQYGTKERFIDLSGLGLEDGDIQDLKYMVNLVDVSLADNFLTDISPLTGLTRLKSIHLGNNRDPADFSPLAGMTCLEFINYQNTAIEDYSFLAGMTGLK